MRPTDCPECKRLFLADYLMQAEARHIAVKSGGSAAEAWVNDQLEAIHTPHQLGEDLMLYGNAFQTLDGKRLDPADVTIVVDDA